MEGLSLICSMAAVLACDAALPDGGPYLDISAGSNLIFAHLGSLRREHDGAGLTITVVRPDASRIEADYVMNCAARTIGAPTMRYRDESGQIVTIHARSRPQPVDEDTQVIFNLGCSETAPDQGLATVDDLDAAIAARGR